MLVLGRKSGQKIIIGDGIEVLVVRVGASGQVTLGIKAPPEVPVHREELRDKLLAQKDAV